MLPCSVHLPPLLVRTINLFLSVFANSACTCKIVFSCAICEPSATSRKLSTFIKNFAQFCDKIVWQFHRISIIVLRSLSRVSCYYYRICYIVAPHLFPIVKVNWHSSGLFEGQKAARHERLLAVTFRTRMQQRQTVASIVEKSEVDGDSRKRPRVKSNYKIWILDTWLIKFSSGINSFLEETKNASEGNSLIPNN